MSLKKKITALASVIAVALTSAASTFTVSNSKPMPVSAVDDNNDDWLHAVGSRLYDKDGNQVWLTGANWFGLNCSENIPHGLYAADCDDFLKSVADHGINIIRFPISTELLVSWMDGRPNPVSSVNAGYEPPYVDINRDFVYEDGKTIKNSMEIFDVIMKKCKEHGIKALIDVHSPTAHNSGHNYNVWYYNDEAEDCDGMAMTKDGVKITEDMWIDSITWLAKKYSNDDTILAYDLKNEPHGKRGYSGSKCPGGIAKWDNSTDMNNWKYAAEKCGKSILSVNPNALILIEGVEQYPKTDKGNTYDTPDIWEAPADKSPWYGAWWGGNLRGVKDYPVDFGSSSLNQQIVYSPHDYGPSVYAQTWFNKDFTTQTLLDDYWYDTWAYINDKDIAPLLIGEWGGHMDGAENQKWMELLRDYMIDNHINHTFWCLNPNSGDTGGLLGYDFQTWDKDKYGLFEESLWQTTSGKYIGLDHQKALGANGISVSDYYKGSEGSNLDSDGSSNPKDPVVVPTEPATTTTKPATTPAATTTTTTTSAAVTTTSSSSNTAPQNPADVTPGDVNNDKKVNIFDSIALKRYIINPVKSPVSQLRAADVNGDNAVDVADLVLLNKFLLGDKNVKLK